MNTARTQFTATRGHSMAARHACTKSICGGCTHDCSQGDTCACATFIKHDYPQPYRKMLGIRIEMDLGRRRSVAGRLMMLFGAVAVVALAAGYLGVRMGWL